MRKRMTPVRRCLRKVDDAASLADPALVERVSEALDELERAYPRPSERIVALEAVLQEFDRGRQAGGTPLGRFLRISVDRRQNRWARREGAETGVRARQPGRPAPASHPRDRIGAQDSHMTSA